MVGSRRYRAWPNDGVLQTGTGPREYRAFLRPRLRQWACTANHLKPVGMLGRTGLCSTRRHIHTSMCPLLTINPMARRNPPRFIHLASRLLKNRFRAWQGAWGGIRHRVAISTAIRMRRRMTANSSCNLVLGKSADTLGRTAPCNTPRCLRTSMWLLPTTDLTASPGFPRFICMAVWLSKNRFRVTHGQRKWPSVCFLPLARLSDRLVNMVLTNSSYTPGPFGQDTQSRNSLSPSLFLSLSLSLSLSFCLSLSSSAVIIGLRTDVCWCNYLCEQTTPVSSTDGMNQTPSVP